MQFRSTLLALLICSGWTSSHGSETSNLFDEMFSALGGREAIGALRSLSVEADCNGPGGDFDTRVESLRPGYVRFEQISERGTTEIWSGPDRTWRDDAEAGTKELDPNVRLFVRDHEFHLLLFEIEERFANHRAGETKLLGDQRCRTILMEDAAGKPAAICLAERDGLPLEFSLNPEGAAGPLVITFDDWRRVGGVRYFYSFTLAEGDERVFTYAYRKITPDVVLADLFVPRAAPALQQDQQAILSILRDDRRAHLATDAALLTSHLADSLIEISDGEVHTRSRAEVEALFVNVFEGASYLFWDDTRPPIIRISADGTLAWVVRRVRVRREVRGVVAGFESAYTATYEKRAGAWRMTSVTSTFVR